MRLVLLGCPGAGKGTQARFIAEKYHLPHISTGDILRTAIRHDTPLGKQVKTIIENGQLVPDEWMITLIKERLKQTDCGKGFLLDGFPRTYAQARLLTSLTSLDAIIDIEVPDVEIIKRLSGRRMHPASQRIYHILYHPPRIPDRDDVTGEPLIQRSDDLAETIQKRLAIYHQQMGSLKQYYQQHTVPWIIIDGTQPITLVTEKIFFALDQLGSVDNWLSQAKNEDIESK